MKINTRKSRLALISLALALIMSSVMALPTTPAHAATPIYVDGATGNDAWDGQAPLWDGTHGPKKTIQAGINAVDAGGTVNVAAGTYNLTAPIVVNKAVTLTGDTTTPSNVVVNAPTVVTAPCIADRDCFQVRANNVTIEGFRIQGAHIASGSDGWQNAGIVIGGDPAMICGIAPNRIVGIQNTVIRYNEITNNSYGIHCYRCQHTTISDNKIFANTQDGNWSGKGIMFYSQIVGGDPNPSVQVYDVDILNNEIYDNKLMGIEFNNTDGITGDINLDVLIDGNTFYNNGGPWDALGYAFDVYRGISANGTATGGETGVTITNNEIYNHPSTSGARFSYSAAIRAYDPKNWIIDHNNLHDNVVGIRLQSSGIATGNAVTNNEIHANVQGIRFDNGNVGFAHCNNIYGNNVATYAGISPYGAVNVGAGSFDAENNWWGSTSGPNDPTGTAEVPPCTGTPANEENADGTGDAVSDNVDYCPWHGIAPATLPNGTSGTAYDQTLTASGGIGSYTFAVTAGTLPTGLTLESNGQLHGTPTAAGTFNFTVTATDASGCTSSQAYAITIIPPTITLSPATLPNGTVGIAYNQTLTASGGTAPYTFAVTAGALPPGLTLSPDGMLSGKPTAAGTFNFTITVTDANGNTGSQAYSLTIVKLAPVGGFIVPVNIVELLAPWLGLAAVFALAALGVALARRRRV